MDNSAQSIGCCLLNPYDANFFSSLAYRPIEIQWAMFMQRRVCGYEGNFSLSLVCDVNNAWDRPLLDTQAFAYTHCALLISK